MRASPDILALNAGTVAVVIPCYRVRRHILAVLQAVPSYVHHVIVVDDACPEESGRYVERHCKDTRVQVIYHKENQGVGGATMTGYRASLECGAEIIVKIDGDGQMDPSLLPQLIAPLEQGRADYVKGNRFFDIDALQAMPTMRLFGNSCLSFVNKITSGYWDIMDPTNGFTAIHATALGMLPLEKIERRYFFESDMLFRLGTIRAVVVDMPMVAQYGDEQSSLSIRKVLLTFPGRYCTRIIKRLFYSYFLRGFNIATLHMLIGSCLCTFGAVFGLVSWAHYSSLNIPAPTGTIALAGLPLIMGFQLLLAALHYDVTALPTTPLQRVFGAKGGISGASLHEHTGFHEYTLATQREQSR